MNPVIARWDPDRIAELPQWIRNDVPKYRNHPGMAGAVERALLAADLLEAVIVTHIGCKTNVCPTRQAMHRELIHHATPKEQR